MNRTYYGKLIFELSKPGRTGYSLPACPFNTYRLSDLPAHLKRQSDTILPEADELTVTRHYTNMSNNNFGVDTGFYPVGKLYDEVQPQNQ